MSGKSEAQQAVLFLPRARDLIVRQRPRLSNRLRSLLAELGIIIPQRTGAELKYAKGVPNGEKLALPEVAIDVLKNLGQQRVALRLRLRWYEPRMRPYSKPDKRMMLLRTIPGFGPVTASAIAATVGDAKQFKNGRQFAAWLGLTPLNFSSAGKERLGPITKMDARYIRRLPVTGMTPRLRQMKVNPDRVEVRDALLSDKPYGTWSRKPSRPAAM